MISWLIYCVGVSDKNSSQPELVVLTAEDEIAYAQECYRDRGKFKSDKLCIAH